MLNKIILTSIKMLISIEYTCWIYDKIGGEVFIESSGNHDDYSIRFRMDILLIKEGLLRESRHRCYKDEFEIDRKTYQKPREITSSLRAFEQIYPFNKWHHGCKCLWVY